jgi:hypothetical protein
VAPLAEAIIDWDALLSVLWASLLGGIGVTAAFAFTILGATRAVDMRRDGRVAAAGAYGALMILAVVVVVAAVVFGIVVMTSK